MVLVDSRRWKDSARRPANGESRIRRREVVLWSPTRVRAGGGGARRGRDASMWRQRRAAQQALEEDGGGRARGCGTRRPGRIPRTARRLSELLTRRMAANRESRPGEVEGGAACFFHPKYYAELARS